MTTRRLPKIANVASVRPQNLAFEPPHSALDRWSPGLHAAAGEADNVISIYDFIGSDGWTEGITAKRIAAALRAIGSRDVVVNINSPGGDVFEGIAIYNLLREHPHQVTVRVVGLAASAASIIAMAGDRIEMARASFMMIHNAWTIAWGDRHVMAEVSDWLSPFDDALASVYAARTGNDKKAIAAMMDKETWFSADQAIDQGFADDYMPADQVVEEEPENPAAFARREIEMALAKAGFTRNQRMQITNVAFRGARDAAPGRTVGGARDAADDEQDAARDAGEVVRAAGFEQLLESLRT